MHSVPFPQYLATPWLTITRKSWADKRPSVSKALQVSHRHSILESGSLSRNIPKCQVLPSAVASPGGRCRRFGWPGSDAEGHSAAGKARSTPPPSVEPGTPNAAARLRPFPVRSARDGVALRHHTPDAASPLRAPRTPGSRRRPRLARAPVPAVRYPPPPPSHTPPRAPRSRQCRGPACPPSPDSSSALPPPRAPPPPPETRPSSPAFPARARVYPAVSRRPLAPLPKRVSPAPPPPPPHTHRHIHKRRGPPRREAAAQTLVLTF